MIRIILIQILTGVYDSNQNNGDSNQYLYGGSMIRIGVHGYQINLHHNLKLGFALHIQIIKIMIQIKFTFSVLF